MTTDGVVGGRYRLHEQIGSGGMGTVWRATDELLGRQVAIKRIRLDLLDGESAEVTRQRTLREARIAAQLHHQHVVTIFDVLIVDGDPWLVLEFVPSQNLSGALETRGPMAPADAAALGAQVADALAAAHTAGITHRDVKPANVLLAAGGAVKLTDFGISHATGDVTITRTNLLTGTPAFLAPEVARGGQGGSSSDVYSLGATLYAAVEGAPPYGESHENVFRLLQLVAGGQVPAPQRAGALEPVLRRMMDPDPAKRPSAAEARDALRAAAGSAAPAPGPLVSDPRTSRFSGPPPFPPAALSLGPPPQGPRPAPQGPAGPPFPTTPYGSSGPPYGHSGPLPGPYGGYPPPPQQPRSRRGLVIAAVLVAVLVAAVGAVVAVVTTSGGTVIAQPSSTPPASSAAPTTGPNTGSPIPGADPRTADPCTLVDPAPLQTYGSAQVDVDFADFSTCQMTVFPPAGGAVIVALQFYPQLAPSDSLAGAVEVLGDIAVGRTSVSDNGTYCERTILLADRTQAVVSAATRQGATADVCTMAETATQTALDKLMTTGIGTRPLVEAPNSLAQVDACGLLDATALSVVPALSGAVPEPGFANWTCGWGGGNTSISVFLTRQGAVDPEDGTPTTIAGRQVLVLPGGYTSGPSCLVQVVHRTFVAANGEQRIEKMQVLYNGTGTAEENCAVATQLATSAIPLLPPPS